MTNANFKFISDAQGGDHFTVVSFSAQEGLSTLYRYEIELKAPVMEEIDLDEVLDAHARFVTELDGVEHPVHGVLSSFEETRFAQNYSYYRAVLVPRIWKLSNYRTNEIYYEAGNGGEDGAGQSIDRIINQLLEKAGMVGSEYDLAGLTGRLLKREYRCQYNESDFDFISRLMENEGVFYYFEQGEAEETIVFINDLNYLDIPRPRLLFDVAAQSKNQDDCVYALSCRKQRLPENVIVRDYNPDEPSLDVSDITLIDSMGQGTEYIYGKNVLSDIEATYLSQIRAEEHICRKTQFFGESSVTRLRSGHLFVLEGHPNDNYNGVEYLAVEINHEGASLDMALTPTGRNEAQPQYRNSFVAIPAEVQYRPPRTTPKPKITGTLHAVIDGELDSEYAQLDSEGRYKVSMPFDFHNEEHPEGLASARVRMMQPYAGKDRGMQFPLAKGTEVLLSFVDGDPDRPIIAGAINSTPAPGPVNADNQTESVIQTGGNNKIRLNDQEGQERLVLSTPQSNSWIRMGAHNDPIVLNGKATVNLTVGDSYTESGAKTTRDGVAVDLPAVVSDPPFDKNTADTYRYTYQSAASSTGTVDTAIRTVIVHPAGDNIKQEIADMDGIRIRSGSSLWLESGSRYGNYLSGVPGLSDVSVYPYEDNLDKSPAQIGNMLNNFGFSYNPTNLLNYKTATAAGAGQNPGGTMAEAVVGQEVKVSSLDTFTTQEGNIYDFGGYWNYNLGNCYIENSISQVPVLNEKKDLNAINSDGDTTTVPDMLNTGGPGWTSLVWPAVTELNSSEQQLAGSWANGNLWVEKKYGKSYDYLEGDSVGVTVGSSLDVQYGGRHIEFGYRGDGTLSSWSHSESGKTKEKKWTSAGTLIYESETESTSTFINELEKKYDRNTGALYSHTHSQGTGMGIAKFEFDYSNTVSLTVNSGSLVSSETFLGGKITNENYIGGLISIGAFVGGKIDMNFALAGLLEINNTDVKGTWPGFTSNFQLNHSTQNVVDMKNALTTLKTTATDTETAAVKNIASLLTMIA